MTWAMTDKGYRKTATFITVIYLIAAPLPEILKST